MNCAGYCSKENSANDRFQYEKEQAAKDRRLLHFIQPDIKKIKDF
jgi:hypothetical protein